MAFTLSPRLSTSVSGKSCLIWSHCFWYSFHRGLRRGGTLPSGQCAYLTTAGIWEGQWGPRLGDRQKAGTWNLLAAIFSYIIKTHFWNVYRVPCIYFPFLCQYHSNVTLLYDLLSQKVAGSTVYIPCFSKAPPSPSMYGFPLITWTNADSKMIGNFPRLTWTAGRFETDGSNMNTQGWHLTKAGTSPKSYKKQGTKQAHIGYWQECVCLPWWMLW